MKEEKKYGKHFGETLAIYERLLYNFFLCRCNRRWLK